MRWELPSDCCARSFSSRRNFDRTGSAARTSAADASPGRPGQFNQDVVSLGTHSAMTAMDVTRLLRDVVSITLLSAAQAVDLREGGEHLGVGTRPIYQTLRSVSGFVKSDRALDRDIAAVSELLDQRKIPALRSS